MKKISLVPLLIIAFCLPSALVWSQSGGGNRPKQWTYTGKGEDGHEFIIVITQGKKGYELSGYGPECDIHGTYFPTTGRFRGRCESITPGRHEDEVVGTALKGEDGFKVTIGNQNLVVKRPDPKQTATTSGVRPCTADERAAFARMTGAWKAYRIDLTISGSCEQATGTYKVTEWCEGVDTTYNTATPRATGEIEGRMQGNYLEFNHETHWRPEFHAPRKGNGTCSLNSDGSLRCSSLPCSNDALKK